MAIRIPIDEADATAVLGELALRAAAVGVPEGLVDGLCLYVVHGIIPGSFLTAVLSNDLMEAFARADLTSRAGMFQIVSFLYNECPSASWGSKEKLLEWAGHKGLRGCA